MVGPAGRLTGVGRITGLPAGYACAVLVALMARAPLLDHTWAEQLDGYEALAVLPHGRTATHPRIRPP